MAVIKVNTVIVGGGHCGCNFACWLEKNDPERSYIVLERDASLLPKWRNFRWEGFQINTPVRFSALHGEDLGDDETLDRPITQDLKRWDDYIAKMNLKYQLNANVDSVEKNEDGDFVTTVTMKNDDGSQEKVTYISRNVLAANGNYDHPKITEDKELAQSHPGIKQVVPFGMTLNDLQPGGVLIIGGGQTGTQLANLLVEETEHTPIAMCSSKIMGTPRSYRGRDIFFWMEQSKFIFMPKEALQGMPPEQAAGLRYGHNPITGACKPISPFSLQRKGVEILGGFDTFQDSPSGECEAVIRPNRAENIQFSVEGYEKIMAMICTGTVDRLEKEGSTFEAHVPEAEWVLQSEEDKQLLKQNGPLLYNLTQKGITNVIWATGLASDFSWLNVTGAVDEFDKRTNLPDDLKCEAAPGLFFSGFPWVGNQQSTNLVNFDQDHAVIATSLRD